MRIGIFGGTFDPPHLGHLILAAEAVDSLQLDKMLWVLTPDPPHKQSQMISPAEDRMAMTKRMVECSPSFEFSDIEFRRPGPHYALDTVNALRLENPGSELFYVIGGDSLRDIPTWHKPTEFILACDHILVMQRPGSTPDLTILYKNYPEFKNQAGILGCSVDRDFGCQYSSKSEAATCLLAVRHSTGVSNHRRTWIISVENKKRTVRYAFCIKVGPDLFLD